MRYLIRYILLSLLLPTIVSCTADFGAEGATDFTGVFSVDSDESGGARICWDAGENGSNYYLFGDFEQTEVLQTTTDTCTVYNDYESNKTYVFSVGYFSSKEGAVIKGGNRISWKAPNNPINFAGITAAVAISDTAIQVFWARARSSNVVAYKVFFSSDTINSIDVAGVDDTSSIITGLAAGTYYKFIVRATNGTVDDTNYVQKGDTTLLEAVPTSTGLTAAVTLTGAESLSRFKAVFGSVTYPPACGPTRGWRVFVREMPTGVTNFSLAAPMISADNSQPGLGPFIVPPAGDATVTGISSSIQIQRGKTYGAIGRPFCLSSGTGNLLENRNATEQVVTIPTDFVPPDPPELAQVTPGAGPLTGGNPLTLVGTNFVSGMKVKIGSAADIVANVISSTQAILTAPALSAGLKTIILTNSDGGSSSAPNAYEYTTRPAPRGTSLDFTSGPTAGGQLVTVTGSGFLNGLTCTLGTQECVTVTVISATQFTFTTPPGPSGSATLKMANYDGQYSSMQDIYTYQGPPVITSVTPDSSRISGGVTITITGSNFLPGLTVALEGAACTSIQILNAGTTIRCSTPAQIEERPYSLTVSNMDGQSATKIDAIRYVGPPRVTSIVPNGGSINGGTSVGISGSGFQDGSSVSIKGATCGSFVRVNSAFITCTTGLAVAGTGDVVVVGPDSQAGTLVAAYTYRPAPRITSISPRIGHPNGGQAVTINGTGFLDGVQVRFGTSTVSLYTSVSATQIRLTSPSNPGGTQVVSVFAQNPDGQESQDESPNSLGQRANGYSFTSAAAVNLTGANPTIGRPEAGYTVLLQGTNFQSGARVFFGSTQVSNANVTFVSPTQLSVVRPALVVNTYNVRVFNPDWQEDTEVDLYRIVDLPPPTLDSISPSYGVPAGGTTITLIGSNFQNGAVARVNSTNCTSSTFVSSNSLTCVTPPGTTGVRDITITNPDTQASTLAAAFTYTGQPTLTGANPSQGNWRGGDRILLTGTLFLPGATVFIDGVACSAAVVDPNSGGRNCSCTVPRHVNGVHAIRFVNPDGQEVTVNNAYTMRPSPIIQNVTPNDNLNTLGGDQIVVSGANFVAGMQVQITNNSGIYTNCTSIQFRDDKEVMCVSNSRGAGKAGIKVRNPDGQEFERPEALWYGSPRVYDRLALVAGNPTQYGYFDSTTASLARFSNVYSMTRHSDGIVYANDWDNRVIRSLNLTSGRVQTTSGVLRTTEIPHGVISDGTDLYAVRWNGNARFFRINTSTGVETLVRAFNTGGYAYGNLVANGGWIYMAVRDRQYILRMKPVTGEMEVVAGANNVAGYNDAVIGANARFNSPRGIAINGTDMYVADESNRVIRKIDLNDPAFPVTTVAGAYNVATAVDGLYGVNRLWVPRQLLVMGTSMYILDSHMLRVMNLATGNITTFNNTANNAGYVDGPIGAARMNDPTGLLSVGTMLYIADQGNSLIRSFDTATATTMGTRFGGGYVAGPRNNLTGSAARFNRYGDVAELNGLFYAPEIDFPIMRVINPTTGTTATMNTSGTGGDNKYVTSDGKRLFIGYQNRGCIEEWDPVTDTTITPLAGRCGSRATIDGPDGTARINVIRNMVTDARYIWIIDNEVLRRIQIDNGSIVTLNPLAGQTAGAYLSPTPVPIASMDFCNARNMFAAGKKIYIGNYNCSGEVYVYDQTTGEVGVVINGGSNPYGGFLVTGNIFWAHRINTTVTMYWHDLTGPMNVRNYVTPNGFEQFGQFSLPASDPTSAWIANTQWPILFRGDLYHSVGNVNGFRRLSQ